LSDPVNLFDSFGLDYGDTFGDPYFEMEFEVLFNAYANEVNSALDVSLNEGVKTIVDVGAQTLAEELAEDFISRSFAAALRKINFLLSIFEPFPREAHAPTMKNDTACATKKSHDD
jgi:hypothetical protein